MAWNIHEPIAMPKLFLSYRRGDSADVTWRLHDHLKVHFGEDSIFLDEDSIPPGLDFREYIDDQLSNCHALLAVIGESWSRAADERGHRRLLDPNDWVRIEIETALARDIPVIPLLVGKAMMPNARELPGDLKELVNRQAAKVRGGADFNNDVQQLIQRLDRMIDGGADGNHGAARSIASNRTVLLGVAAGVLLAGLGAWLVGKPGRRQDQGPAVANKAEDGSGSNPGPGKKAPAVERPDTTPNKSAPETTITPKVETSRPSAPMPPKTTPMPKTVSTELRPLDSTQRAIAPEEAAEIQRAWAAHYGLSSPLTVTVGGRPMEFVLIPPGSFDMTSQRRVRITKTLFMGVCEVRQAEYAAIMSTNPSSFKKKAAPQTITELADVPNTDDFPVESVTWDEAQAFAGKILNACKNALPNKKITVRLPTEAEWEYAGRAGALSPYQNDQLQLTASDANFNRSLKRTERCGKFSPNPFGLRDMHGNVAEWCQDGYVETLGAFEVTDPLENPKSELVVRGGSWLDGPDQCTFSARASYRHDSSSRFIGIRMVIVVESQK